MRSPAALRHEGLDTPLRQWLIFAVKRLRPYQPALRVDGVEQPPKFLADPFQLTCVVESRFAMKHDRGRFAAPVPVEKYQRAFVCQKGTFTATIARLLAAPGKWSVSP